MQKHKTNKIEEKEKKELDLQKLFKDYLLPTLSLVILLLIIFLITIPTISNIIKNRNLVVEKKAELQDLQEYYDKVVSVTKDKGSLNEANAVLDKYLPQESMLSSFIDDVNLMAEEVGLEPTSLEGSEEIGVNDEDGNSATDVVMGDDEEISNPHRVYAILNYEGDFKSVYNLFEKINQFRGLLTVQSVSFSENENDNNWIIMINVSSYNLPQEVLDYVVENQLFRKSTNNFPVFDAILLEQIKERVK